MSEYYIRSEGDEEARGPFNIDQLTSLIEAGKLDTEAFFYDPTSEEWVKIKENQELMDILYPKKTKLKLRREEPETPKKVENSVEGEEGDSNDSPTSGEDETDNSTSSPQTTEPQEEHQRISVADMLAQAEGRERENAKGQTPTEIKASAAYTGMLSTTVLLFISAAALGYLDLETLKSADVVTMFRSPYFVTALIDAVLGILMLLQVTLLYPLIRFRAALGLGFFTLLYFSTHEYILLASNALLMIALYLCTAVVNKSKALIFLTIGVLGAAGYAYLLFM